MGHCQNQTEVSRMVDIEYLEQKKTEIVADHVRRCGATPLDEAEKYLIKEFDVQIRMLKRMRGEQDE